MKQAKKNRTRIRLWSLVAALMAGLAMARGARADDVVYEKHTVVEFGDDTIEGDLSRPDGSFLEARKKQRLARLIKVRESFRAEILESVREL